MKVLVTGSRGKVGRAAVEALVAAGHDVTGVDLVRPVFDAGVVVPGRYVMADLTDQGDAFAVVAGMDAVVHVAAIPQPTGNPAHVVLQTNLMSTFHLIEAAVRFGVPRFVNISSESIVGNFFPSGRSCRTTRPSTRSTRCTRRIRTRSRRRSASS
ncbi:NAD-dependent epimerase/dehydratase family protein [Clavibacter tessellarius]|uniref:NAD-dependent epimerase/dehydratase family protein n=1 Tax=Clavibacter tessellarius TaxID=31965 RepID=UPI003253FDEB